jgi:hypothetical protein
VIRRKHAQGRDFYTRNKRVIALSSKNSHTIHGEDIHIVDSLVGFSILFGESDSGKVHVTSVRSF